MEYQFTEPSTKTACFDLDGTLIKTKSGRQFPTSIADWEYAYDNVLDILTRLQAAGWKIVIFTNQKKTKTSISFDNLLTKLSKVLPFTVDVFMSNSSDYFRKPMIGMWDEFVALNGKPTSAFYVGDAAGRDADHSDADRRFAHNIGIPFYLPEEVFDNPNFDVQTFTPAHHTHPDIEDIPLVNKFLPRVVDPLPRLTQYITEKELVVIVMTGRPASGKSYLTKQITSIFPGTVVVSNDQTGAPAKSKKLFAQSVANNTPVIIVDNTSPSVESRAPYILMTPETYRVVSVHAILDEENCILLDEERAYAGKTITIPSLVYRIYNSKFQAPSKAEGFHLLLNYVPEKCQAKKK